MHSNFERMLQLVEDVFYIKDDPTQLDVNEEVMERLARIHPATLSEFDDGNGPAAWVLLIPTTKQLMEAFVSGEIGEQEMYARTPEGGSYDALYLCSALVLEEYRRQGIAKRLTLQALEEIRRDHPIEILGVWAFSEEGKLGAQALAQLTGMPLLERK